MSPRELRAGADLPDHYAGKRDRPRKNAVRPLIGQGEEPAKLTIGCYRSELDRMTEAAHKEGISTSLWAKRALLKALGEVSQ